MNKQNSYAKHVSQQKIPAKGHLTLFANKVVKTIGVDWHGCNWKSGKYHKFEKKNL
jgi:hypothetical protein